MATIPAQVFDNYNIPEIVFGWSDQQPSMSAGLPETTTLSNTIAMLFWPNNSPSFPVTVGILAYRSQVQLYYGARMGGTFTYDNKTVYYTSNVGSCTAESQALTGVEINDASVAPSILSRVAWLMVYGGYLDTYDVTYDLVNCVGDVNNPDKIPINAVLTNAYFTASDDAKFMSTSCTIDGTGIDADSPVLFVWDYDAGHLKIGVITSNIIVHIRAYIDPYKQGGTTGDDETEGTGGEGDFDDSSDPIDLPRNPTLEAVNTGFISLYMPSESQLQALATYMWSNPLFDPTAWKKIFADPMDAVLGLSIMPLPYDPPTSSVTVKIGNISTDVTMPRLSGQHYYKSFGSITVNEFWGGYLDYAPYTKAEIYLPYIGTHPIDIDDIMGKTIEVEYHFDLLSGACSALIKCGDSVLYTFLGQMSASIPITGNDWTNVINGVITAGTAIGSMAATGGMTAPMAVPQLAQTAVNNLKPSIEKSGGLTGAGAHQTIQYPYLILTRPRQAVPNNQNAFTGYPSFITRTLSSLSGYTEMEVVHLENVHATDAELTEIETLLKSGVIF